MLRRATRAHSLMLPRRWTRRNSVMLPHAATASAASEPGTARCFACPDSPECVDGLTAVHGLRDSPTLLERTARSKACGLECTTNRGQFVSISDDQPNLMALLVRVARLVGAARRVKDTHVPFAGKALAERACRRS